MLTNRRVTVTGIAAAILVVFFLAPVVPYSVPLPGYYFPYKQGYLSCFRGPAYSQPACLSEHRYPTYNLTGEASLSYLLAGLGAPPFGSKMVLALHNTTLILYFNGANLSSVESRLPPGTVVDPVGVVQVKNVTASVDYLGFLSVNVTVKNVGVGEIADMSVFMSSPPVYGLPTQLSVARAEAFADSNCAQPVSERSTCLVSMSNVLMHPLVTSNGDVPFGLEVKGYVGDSWFVYHTTVVAKPSYRSSPPLIFQGWVSQFIGEANAARGGASLSENATLDQFASLRYGTMVQNYNISHYGYVSDYYQFFHSVIPSGAELYVFPAGFSPTEFAAYLQSSAPGHWQALMDSQFAQYGWYYARGPEVIGLNCSVTEIPGPDINVPQYLEAHGCSTMVIQEGWLVIELSQG